MIAARDRSLVFESAVVSLGSITPLINGEPLAETFFATLSGDVISLRCALPTGQFRASIRQESDSRCWIQYWVEGLPNDFVLDSFGIRFEALTNLRAFLRQGYFSWDGSYYTQAEEYPVGSTIKGYAMTQLLPLFGTGSVVIGFDRHDRYQQPFTLTRTETGFSLTVETMWDQKDRRNLTHCTSERLVIFEHEAVEDALREWASIVAGVMKARTAAPPLMGWCSWYNLYGYITEENILEHLHTTHEVAERENLPLWIFQIDDGFTPEMGDWLDVKPQFPRGMKPLLDDIREAGFTPGLWIAPFMVGNRSRLYREHPDWVVKDRQTGGPIAHMKFYSEFRWHKRSEEYYILDTTHPEAFDYLRLVFRTWRHDWGSEYFKTDFMHFGSEYGPDRAVWHQSGLTRIEIWRRTIEMIREEIGDALWDGCGCPLWASVGVVDAVRIGRDVGVQWHGDSLAAQSLLRDQATRNFGNHILWQADPDCILLREQFHNLTKTELQSLALYAGMSSGLILTSDDISQLSPQRLRLFKLLLSPEKSICRFPLLGQSPLVIQSHQANRPDMRALDPVLVQVRSPLNASAETPVAVFILNTGEMPITRIYPLPLLGLPEGLYVHDWMTGEIATQPLDRLTILLAPHEGRLIFLSPIRLDGVPDQLG